METFAKYALTEKMIIALKAQGYVYPTTIQNLVIPKALKQDNIIAQSETGSGKTLAFLTPIIENIDLDINNYQAIIITPTRELARQIHHCVKSFYPFFPALKARLLVGGMERQKSIDSLAKKGQIIIATPGRMKQMLRDGKVSFAQVKTLVLDEADMLLDLGFFPIVNEIIASLQKAQIMVFSATYSEKLLNILAKHLPDVKKVVVNLKNDIPLITHTAIDIKHKNILECVRDFIDCIQPYFLLIFASNIKTVKAVYDDLVENKYKVGILHGDLEARKRKMMMKKIAANELPIVVCSDIAARGIDFVNVSDVLNVDLPQDLSFYFHRAGRTGRLGCSGNCYTFYCGDGLNILNQLSGVDFSYCKFVDHRLVAIAKPKRKTHTESSELARSIRQAVKQTKTTKVKPGYKKKVRQAIEKTKSQHRRQKIKENIRKQKKEREKENTNEKR